MTLFKVWNLA